MARKRKADDRLLQELVDEQVRDLEALIDEIALPPKPGSPWSPDEIIRESWERVQPILGPVLVLLEVVNRRRAERARAGRKAKAADPETRAKREAKNDEVLERLVPMVETACADAGCKPAGTPDCVNAIRSPIRSLLPKVSDRMVIKALKKVRLNQKKEAQRSFEVIRSRRRGGSPPFHPEKIRPV